MPRGPARPYPSVSLKEAVTIPNGLRDFNAGRPMNRILLAEALRHPPASSRYRDLITAANKYGLITGNYASDNLALTPLGEQITNPSSEEEHLNGLRRAMEKVGLFSKLLGHYNNNRLPSPELLKSILEKPPFLVEAAWSAEAAQVFVATGRYTGMIREVTGTTWVIREAGRPVVDPQEADERDVHDVETSERPQEPALAGGATQFAPSRSDTPTAPPSAADAPPAAAATRQFFIAHGRDRTALAQLQSILKDLDIPYVVAEDEPNVGRPISQKIADLMRACSAGIFIFSGDEEVTDPAGVRVKRPRQNVVYELGAASFQYGQRIVIFKEVGVEFPTDFRDLGYIEYEEDFLSAKSMELLRELIKLKAVRVTAGG